MIVSAIIFFATSLLAEPSSAAISAALLEHRDQYYGLQFEYEMKSDIGKDGRFEIAPDGSIQILEKGSSKIVSSITSRETLRLMRSPDRSDIRIWRDWERKTEQGEPAEWTLTSFVAFNGKQTRLYTWRDPNEGVWSVGNVLPYDDPDPFLENVFDCFLHLNGRGQPQLSIGKMGPTPFKWNVTGQSHKFGHVVYQLEGASEKSPYTFEISILEPPNSIVVRSVVREGTIESAPIHEEYIVDNVGNFEGILYPSSGRYTRQPSSVKGSQFNEFKVTAVKRINTVSDEKWLPEFPPGTAVLDQVNGTNYMVPHDERVLKEAKLRRLNSSPLVAIPRMRWWFIVLNIVILVGLVVVLVRRASKKMT